MSPSTLSFAAAYAGYACMVISIFGVLIALTERRMPIRIAAVITGALALCAYGAAAATVEQVDRSVDVSKRRLATEIERRIPDIRAEVLDAADPFDEAPIVLAHADGRPFAVIPFENGAITGLSRGGRLTPLPGEPDAFYRTVARNEAEDRSRM